ncbi:MAG: hypothetical protein FWC47_10580 [Oscillospiraceae bacterium]|nr:hypothetical protein [Oscillospiraceae bacterium]
MKKKSFISYIIFTLAVIILVLGIIQLIIYIPPQIDMINSARTQGTTDQDISDYIWQQLVPQIISYVITFLGFASILLASGMILLRQSQANLQVAAVEKTKTTNKEALSEGVIIEDFNVVESNVVESKNEPEGEQVNP